MRACFVHQTKDSWGKCQGSCHRKAVYPQLLYGTWHKRLKKNTFFKVTYESYHAKLNSNSSPAWSHFRPLICGLFKAETQRWWVVCIIVQSGLWGSVSQAPSAGAEMIWNYRATRSTERRSSMDHTVPFQGIQTRLTVQLDNWEKFVFLLGNSVRSFWCYYYIVLIHLPLWSCAAQCLTVFAGMFNGSACEPLNSFKAI